ncbi:hypothetical protein XI07_15325, partial [Bradyrhizobium sp. CCBAU 11445]|nr:hypothetical protein [Bradyrhizobium sp. CCBAU 11445]
VTSFIAGTYETVPKKIFNQLKVEVDPTITAISTLLIALTLLALASVSFIRARSGKFKASLLIE